MPSHTAVGAPKLKPYTKKSALVSALKSYSQGATAVAARKLSQLAMLKPTAIMNTRLADSHTGPYRSGLGLMRARKGCGGRKGHSALRTRASTSPSSTSKHAT